MKLLLLSLGLLTLTCSCQADAVCHVPDTQKAYVTALTINLARSVGPCVDPDPSVLLALNLAGVVGGFARETLVKQLEKDAVKKVSENLPFSSGKVALYVLALRSSCSEPTTISSPGGNIDLVNILETKTDEEFQSTGDGRPPLTTWYQVALDVLALCVMCKPSAITAGDALAKAVPSNPSGPAFSVDTSAVAAMAFTCVLQMEDVPPETFASVKGSLSKLLQLILESQNDGLLGNVYCTGLAGQALTAARLYYPSDAWNCSQTITKMAGLIPQGKFSLPGSAAQLLPFLWGETYLSVKNIQCPSHDAPMISVEYTIVNDLLGDHFEHSILVSVEKGSTLLQVMQKAVMIQPEFSFQTETTSWGLYVTTINGVAGSTNEKTYWQFLSGNSVLQEGVATYKVQNNEHILAILSKY